MSIEIIFATDTNGGIGYKNILPWSKYYGVNNEEIKIFRKKTENSIVIFGRKTLQNLPFLPRREIYCLTKSTTLKKDDYKNNFKIINSIEDIFKIKTDKKIFIAGGKQLYDIIFEKYMNKIHKIHISVFKKEFECDTYLIYPKNNFILNKTEEYNNFTHYEYSYNEKNSEYEYLNVLKNILEIGKKRKTRNGIVYSYFHDNMRFDLRKGFPLLTTKKMFTKGIIEELLFFLRGDTDTNKLEDKGVKIWKGNTSREFLDSINMKYRKIGMMGPMYGYQFRYFNAEYDEELGVPKTFGVDQLKNVIETIRTDPNSRRILMTSYNPYQVKEGVLPPCHSITLQFYVDDGYLDLFCYNRSQDIFLGTPFNITSTSLLLCIVSKLTNLKPRILNITMGDIHIYEEHIQCAREQLKRTPYIFPTISIPDISEISDIHKLTYKDFIISDYKHHESIKAKMIV
jgi:dihydrofolate reductase/thymidylate synthase